MIMTHLAGRHYPPTLQCFCVNAVSTFFARHLSSHTPRPCMILRPWETSTTLWPLWSHEGEGPASNAEIILWLDVVGKSQNRCGVPRRRGARKEFRIKFHGQTSFAEVRTPWCPTKAGNQEGMQNKIRQWTSCADVNDPQGEHGDGTSS